MNDRYYDTWEFRQALSYIESNPIEAKAKLEAYLKKYPKDYSMCSYYAGVLITLGKFKKADHVLTYLEVAQKRDFQFSSQRDKLKSLRKNIVFDRLRLLAYLEKYEEMYSYYLRYGKQLEDIDVNDSIFFCKNKLGKLDPNKRDMNSYLYRQIVSYEESDFLEHVKKHLPDYNCDVDEPNKNIFSVDFPINEAIEEVKKYIPSEKRLYMGFIVNSYTFKYDCCGRADNKLVDYFKVVCFHNTNHIITMCPVLDSQNYHYVDLNYMNKKQNERKKESQIDKFNKRFRRN